MVLTINIINVGIKTIIYIFLQVITKNKEINTSKIYIQVGKFAERAK